MRQQRHARRDDGDGAHLLVLRGVVAVRLLGVRRALAHEGGEDLLQATRIHQRLGVASRRRRHGVRQHLQRGVAHEASLRDHAQHQLRALGAPEPVLVLGQQLQWVAKRQHGK